MKARVANCTLESNSQMEALFTLDEASRILRRSHWALRDDYKRGRLRCVRLGRNLMIHPDELRRVIAEGLPTNRQVSQ